MSFASLRISILIGGFDVALDGAKRHYFLWP